MSDTYSWAVPHSVLYLYSFTVNLICISHGMGIGWLSPTLRKLQSTSSPLQFAMDVNDVSWVGSALGLGSMTGNILSGLFINRFGARLCLLCIAVPHTVRNGRTNKICFKLFEPPSFIVYTNIRFLVPLVFGLLCPERRVLDCGSFLGWHYGRRHLHNTSTISQ